MVKISIKLRRFFTCIGKKLQESLQQTVNPIWRNHVQDKPQKSLNPNGATFTFTETNQSEVQIIPKKLKRNKSSGCDDIPIPLIVDGASELATPLTCLINRSMRESVFPACEKSAKVTPVYKSGEKRVMDNYSTISVLPVFSKVLEQVVYKQLYTYLEEN